jgi:TolB protein
MNPDGTGHQLLTTRADADHPSWSPDGTKIAFDRTIAANSDIWVINEDGSGLVQLTTNPAADSSPRGRPTAPGSRSHRRVTATRRSTR